MNIVQEKQLHMVKVLNGSPYSKNGEDQVISVLLVWTFPSHIHSMWPWHSIIEFSSLCFTKKDEHHMYNPINVEETGHTRQPGHTGTRVCMSLVLAVFSYTHTCL